MANLDEGCLRMEIASNTINPLVVGISEYFPVTKVLCMLNSGKDILLACISGFTNRVIWNIYGIILVCQKMIEIIRLRGEATPPHVLSLRPGTTGVQQTTHILTRLLCELLACVRNLSKPSIFNTNATTPAAYQPSADTAIRKPSVELTFRPAKLKSGLELQLWYRLTVANQITPRQRQQISETDEFQCRHQFETSMVEALEPGPFYNSYGGALCPFNLSSRRLPLNR